jgi:hypothetical protein
VHKRGLKKLDVKKLFWKINKFKCFVFYLLSFRDPIGIQVKLMLVNHQEPKHIGFERLSSRVFLKIYLGAFKKFLYIYGLNFC